MKTMMVSNQNSPRVQTTQYQPKADSTKSFTQQSFCAAKVKPSKTISRLKALFYSLIGFGI